MKTKRQIVVIGGGLAGLAAATCAARDGHAVELVERLSELGGRARTRNERGFRFNMGPHALYRGGPGMGVLHELGVVPRGAPPPVSGSRARYGGALHALPGGTVSLLTTGLLSLSEKLETGRFLASIGRMDTAKYDRVSIRETLERELRHEKARELVAALFRLTSYTHDPEHGSGGAALHQARLALGGVLYLHGGWQSLVDDMTQTARSAGVRIRSAVAVEALERDEASGAIRGARLAGGERLAADAVIVAAGPREACELVDAGRDRVLRQWAEQSTPILLSTLDLGLSRLPQPKNRFTLGIDEPTYFSVHSGVAEVAPEGAALIHMARYLMPGEKLDRAELRAGLETQLDALQPGWRDLVVTSKFLHQLEVTQAAVRADCGGLAGRPGPTVAHIPGLFVAGDWVGAAGQLADASLASGREAARLAGAATSRTV